jgi:hypothetical protein
MTKQETYARKLICAGGKLAAKQSTKYVVIEFTYTGAKSGLTRTIKVYLGKAGAIRTGDTVASSASMSEAFLDRLINLA